MHAQAWLATALAIGVASSVGVACGSDATGSGAGGASGSSGAGASSGTGGSAGAQAGGAAGTGNRSGAGGTGTGGRPGGGASAGASAGGTAPGSGATTNGTGGVPKPGSGGGSSCPPECFVNNLCVTSCGQTPNDYGCCPCPPGTVNARTCSASNTDAGPSKGVSCDQRLILCKRVAPVCPDMQVPSVEGTCYGPCVPIDDCVCQAPEDCPDADVYTCHRSQARCGPYV
jgi:hypothetical protein